MYSGGIGLDFISVVLIAVGLSMDAFAVSVTNGMTAKNLKFTYALKIAFFFGGFQFAMPVAGYFLGITFSEFIKSVDHFIAFGLLGIIGGKMIFEALTSKVNDSAQSTARVSTLSLLVLAVATSIDALAVGVSFAFLGGLNVYISCGIIGIITFFICVSGVYIGKKFGALLKKGAEIFGGAVLILIGIKILAEHLFFS